jgi:ribonuclease HI
MPTTPIQPELWIMYFDVSLMKTRVGAGLLFISPFGEHVRYVLRLHFPASNNMAEYEALVNGLRIAVELGVRCLDARGDSQLVIDQVMKNSHYRDQKMEAYCDEVQCLEDKFYGLELNHVARRYNETADELAKITSGRTTVPPDVFSKDIYQPSVKMDDVPEPEEASARPEVPSTAEGEALHVERERNRVTPVPNWQTSYLEYLLRGELPLDKAEARRLARRAKSFVYWVMKRSCTTAAPQAFSNDACPLPKDKICYKKYTRGLVVTMQHLEPSCETLSDKVSTGQPQWPTPLGLYAPAEGVNSTRDRRTCPLKPRRQYPSLGHFRVGSGPRRSLAEGTRGLLAPAGRHRQILQVDRSPTLNQHQVRAGGGVLHKYHPSLWGPKLNHHRQWHAVHWEKVPGLLRGPPHPCGLGRRSAPNDKWAGGTRQRYDFAGTKAEDLQRPQQVWQAMDKRTTLGGLESEDDAEPGHGLHAVLPRLWGRGYLTHGHGIRFPEEKGLRRPKQPDRPRGFIGPAGRGSERGLTTLGAVSAVPATLPRPKGSAPRLPSGRLGT